MSVAQIESLYSQAVTALEAGDFDTAIRKAMAAKMRLGTMANLTQSVGSGSKGMTWPGGESIDSFIRDCRRLKATAASSTGVFTQIPVLYERPDISDDY